MILLDGAAPAPDQLVTLIQALGTSGGPLYVLLGVYLWITLRRDRGEGGETQALLTRVDALAAEVRALTQERAAREQAQREAQIAEQARAAVREELRAGRITGEMPRELPPGSR